MDRHPDRRPPTFYLEEKIDIARARVGGVDSSSARVIRETPGDARDRAQSASRERFGSRLARFGSSTTRAGDRVGRASRVSFARARVDARVEFVGGCARLVLGRAGWKSEGRVVGRHAVRADRRRARANFGRTRRFARPDPDAPPRARAPDDILTDTFGRRHTYLRI